MAVIDIPLPRLLDDSGNFVRTVRPIKVSINLNITPLSYASIELPKGENLPARGYVELFTPMGSAGIFRVRSPSDAYGDYITTAELEHAVTEVADYLVLNDYNEMMAAGTAMQTIFSHYRGSRWRLGSVTALGTGQIAVTANHVRVLEAMLALLEQKPDCMMAFDFSTSPWTINIVSRGTTVTAEGRLARNVNFAKINYDDTELCTRAYYEVETTTGPDGEPSSEWRHVDASTINTYGVVEREVYIGTGITSAEALIAVNAFLNKHKDPRVAIEISAEELSSITGESLDAFEIGKLFRLALVDYNNLIVEQNITGLSWDSVYENPYDVTVYLAEPEDTVINFLHDLDTNGGTMGGSGGGSTSASLGTGGGGGGGGARKKQEDAWKEYYTRFQQTDYFLDLTAVHVDRNNNILQQAGMYIDSQGVLQYAEDNERQIAGKLKLTAESLTSDYTQKIGDTESALEGKITQTAESLTSDYTNKISETEGKITQTAESLTSDYTKKIGDTESALEGKITQTADSLTSDYTDKIADTESHLSQTASEIRSEVEDKEKGLKSSISQNAGKISAHAEKIELIAEDYVTVNRLSTEIESIKQGYADSFTTSEFHGGTCTAVTLDTGALKVGNGGSAAWHTVSVDGTAVGKVLGDSDINFDRAGAYNEGKNSVTLTSQGWQSGGRNVVTASNGKTYTVNLPAFSTSGGDSFSSDYKTTVYFSTASVDGPLASKEVDATSLIYRAQADGASVVRLVSSGWESGGKCVVNAKYYDVLTGQSYTVNLPSFSTSGGDSFSDHKTTVYFHTGSVDGPLASKEVDATPEYSAGATVAFNMVTLSQGSWTGGTLRVTASNGKTTDVSLPTFSASGGTSFSNHKTTVYFSTPSVSGPLKAVEVDASSEYIQGAYDTYHGGNWERPSSDNGWACMIPNDTNSGKETWFNVADILPTPSYSWSNPAKGYAQVEFYICGKYYHTAKQIPGGWM